MLIIRRITDMDQLHGHLVDRILVSDDVMLRVNRTGFALSYLPCADSGWRSYPPAEDALPQQVLAAKDAAFYAAYADDLLIGVAAVCTAPTGWGRLMDVRVDAGHRREGVGAQLLEACQQYAAAHGMAGLCAQVSDANPVMCQFLERLGYVLGGVDRLALTLSPEERVKPQLRRACQLTFYKNNK